MTFRINKPHVVVYNNISEVLDVTAHELVHSETKLGFRGLGNENWDLAPTLSRYVETLKSEFQSDYWDDKKLHEIVAKRILEQFKENLIVNRDLPQDRIEKIDLWQLGQHYGLASPLLDWTFSPYVAIFFALVDRNLENILQNRCIWVLDIELLGLINQRIVSDIRPKYIDKLKPESLLREQFPVMEIVKETNENNRRTAFQQSFFTKHIHYRSFEIWLDRIATELPQNATDTPLLRKLVFPCPNRERMNALDILDRMNINYRTLFPDIYGSVNGALESVKRSFQKSRFRTFLLSQSIDKSRNK